MIRPRKAVRSAASVALVAATALVLFGCSAQAQSGKPIDDYAGGPKGVRAPGGADLEPFASWLDHGDQIALTLYGSSGCPPVGESMRVRSSNSLVVELVPIAPDKACTADYAPHTTVFATPSDVTTTSDVSILVDDQSITLPAMR
ncbi:hypothetical protein [Leifsonia sp. Leaf264]|uniref:hypothetical protein n=1 Tax=Leifsonia sp. Leaf264 TaxID=1736314 RepID=UPI0007023233|nr:hypothetical protein [Leifsonia sp. Leaf264]KQO97513.1 hypothetical protein ASF30_13875 [Leifsonia sp. Leaf264]